MRFRYTRCGVKPKKSLKIARQENLPIKEPKYDNYDCNSELQIIVDSVENLKGICRRRTDRSRRLNTIVHLNNRLCSLFIYIEKHSDAVLAGQAKDLLEELSHLRAVMKEEVENINPVIVTEAVVERLSCRLEKVVQVKFSENKENACVSTHVNGEMSNHTFFGKLPHLTSHLYSLLRVTDRADCSMLLYFIVIALKI